MSRDRININLKYRDWITEWKENNILGFKMLDAKEIFFLAASLGLNNPQSFSGAKDGFFRLDNHNYSLVDKAMFTSFSLGVKEHYDDIDKFANDEYNYDEAEKCAESGFLVLKEIIDKAGGDEELLEKRMMSELSMLYQKNVKSNLY